MQWYQVKEQAAGKKRLMLLWYIYNLFGKKAVNFIAFFVTFFAFIFAKDVRGYSKKYLTVINPLTGIKPNLINQFKHFLSYTHVLTDKIEIYPNKFDKNKQRMVSMNIISYFFSFLKKNFYKIKLIV